MLTRKLRYHIVQTIDFETVKSLELLANAVDGTATGTLFQCLNFTNVRTLTSGW